MSFSTPLDNATDIGRIFAAMGADLVSFADEKGWAFHLSINTLHAFSHLDAAGGKPVITLHVTGAQDPDAMAASVVQTHLYRVNFRVMIMTNIGFDANRSDSLYVVEGGTPLFEVIAAIRARILAYRLPSNLVYKGYAMGGQLNELRELAESPFYGYALDFYLTCNWPAATSTITLTLVQDDAEEEP